MINCQRSRLAVGHFNILHEGAEHSPSVTKVPSTSRTVKAVPVDVIWLEQPFDGDPSLESAVCLSAALPALPIFPAVTSHVGGAQVYNAYLLR